MITPEQLKRLRAEKGLTQGQIGDLLGVHSKTVGRWETGGASMGRHDERILRAKVGELGRDLDSLNTVPAWDRGQIIDLRYSLGLTQSEFASRLDVSRMLVSRWEHGHCVPSTVNNGKLTRLKAERQESEA